MAILEFYETFEERTGSMNSRYIRDYTRTFVAITDTATDGPELIRLHPSCPRPWSFYASASGYVELGSWAKEITVRQDTADPYTWRVRVHYSSEIERPDITNEIPTLRPPVVEWGQTSIMKPLAVANDGTPITNSAWERFDPPPEIEDVRLTLSIQINLLTYDPLFYLGFHNTVNDDTWFSFPPGTVRCMGVTGTRQYESGYLFWDTRFNFQIKKGTPEYNDRDAWAIKILDRGFMALDNAGNQYRLIDPRFGTPLATPALLDGAGGRLAVNATPFYITVFAYQNKNFRDLLAL